MNEPERSYEFPVEAAPSAQLDRVQLAARRRRTILRFAWGVAALVGVTAAAVVLGAQDPLDAWPQMLVVAIALLRIASLSRGGRRAAAEPM